MGADFPASIEDAGTLLRARRLSSLELTRELLGRANASQDTVSAFMTITEESALEAARTADAELANGTDRGPLHGIPLGIKDILATSDAPTTANSRVLDPAWGHREDASVVRQLKSAGAVSLGKLVLHEFAIGWPDPATGLRFARNPWDLSRSPGGSSSGTGAAIAADLILGGLGTDTGGSIRGPAAYCGITGLKPTFGRVSKEGCVPLSYSLDHIGPMARTARDCALMLQAIAGHDPRDPSSAAVRVPDFASALSGQPRGLRIGVERDNFFDARELNAEVRQAVLEAIQHLEANGAVTREIALPHAAIARYAQGVIMLGEAYAYHLPDLQSQPELYGKYTRQQIQHGALYSAGDYVQAQRIRWLIKEEALRALSSVDVLIAPTVLNAAPKFEGYDPDALRRSPSFTSVWNLTGLPAASVCCGFTRDGLPIGMQIVGRPFDEAMVLRAADAYQQISDWHTRRPRVAREAQPA